MLSENGLFEIIEVETAEDLLAELSPATGSRWDRPSRADDWDWIYRGQADARWGLTPSALREGSFEPFKPGWMGRPWNPEPDEQLNVEESAVNDFSTLVDHQGLAVPGDRPELRDQLLAAERNEVWDFPRVQSRFMYALAQHYGVPTRLLDWSRSPKVAAYFACVDVAKARKFGERCTEKFAIWTISRAFLNTFFRKRNPAVIVITMPTVHNPNLHAQQGLFTLVSPHPTAADPRVPDLEKVVADAEIETTEEDHELASRLPAMCKYEVPASEAGALLRSLAIDGVSAASVFPGHHGAVMAMKESRCYQNLPRSRR